MQTTILILAAAIAAADVSEPVAEGAATGTISGVVSNESSGRANGVEMRLFMPDGSLVSTARTNIDGEYAFQAEPGQYFVITNALNATFNDRFLVNEINDGSPCIGHVLPPQPGCDLSSATPLDVTEMATTTADFVLDFGGSITGTLTEGTTGAGIVAPDVLIFDLFGEFLYRVDSRNGLTASGHSFTSEMLPMGDYRMIVDAVGFIPVSYLDRPCPELDCDPALGNAVTVNPMTSTQIAPMALTFDPDQGGAVSGQLIGPEGISLGASTQVRATTSGGVLLARSGTIRSSFAAQSAYFIAGLPPGTIRVLTRFSSLQDELFNNLPCDPFCLTGAGTPVNVTAGAITPGINFALGDGVPRVAPIPRKNPRDELGKAVAVDRGRVAVGQPNANDGAGRVVMLRRDGDTFVEEQVIDAPAGFTVSGFGSALALRGNLLLVGAPVVGGQASAKGSPLHAALLERVSGEWQQKAEYASDQAADDGFGSAVALVQGMAVVGAPGDATGEAGVGSGAVFVFDDGGGLLLTKKPSAASPGAQFGAALAATGNHVAVGSPGGSIEAAVGNSVSLFTLIGNNLEAGPVVRAAADSDQFGAAIVIHGDRLLVGAPGNDEVGMNAGAVYLFDLDGAALADATAPTPEVDGAFGAAVGMNARETVIGAPGMSAGNGLVVRLNRDLGPGAKPTTPEDARAFGAAIAVDDTVLVIGAPDSQAEAGDAYFLADPDALFSGNFE